MPLLIRWFRFRLWTLFALITLAAVPMAWVASSLNWIEERHRRLHPPYYNMPNDNPEDWFVVEISSSIRTRAPLELSLFGEKGTAVIYYFGNAEHWEEAQGLFPEAQLVGR